MSHTTAPAPVVLAPVAAPVLASAPLYAPAAAPVLASAPLYAPFPVPFMLPPLPVPIRKKYLWLVSEIDPNSSAISANNATKAASAASAAKGINNP